MSYRKHQQLIHLHAVPSAILREIARPLRLMDGVMVNKSVEARKLIMLQNDHGIPQQTRDKWYQLFLQRPEINQNNIV